MIIDDIPMAGCEAHLDLKAVGQAGEDERHEKSESNLCDVPIEIDCSRFFNVPPELLIIITEIAEGKRKCIGMALELVQKEPLTY